MIFLIHQKAAKVIKILKDNEPISIGPFFKLSHTFWTLAEAYPEEIIVWCEEELYPSLNKNFLSQIFYHDGIMVSYSAKTNFLPDKIGYIDQLPFINLNRKVVYPTWRMSTDIGGIKGGTLLQFKNVFNNIKDFGFLLNSIAKLGQQNGLFCYSVPELLIKNAPIIPLGNNIRIIAGAEQTFSFVYAHYKTFRIFILFYCYWKYERTFPIWELCGALLKRKYYKKDIDLTHISFRPKTIKELNNAIDVIIPTLGRRDYLLKVLDDLKSQSLLPKKVIVIEQNPDPESQSELSFLQTPGWPFEIIHHFIHKTGACMARNMALKEVTSDWIFFADDDIRFNSNLLSTSLMELNRLGANCLNINCKQEGEATVFNKIKQWGSFGSGTSMVNAFYCKNLRFDEVFEYGFGEDLDFGMQLRNNGCDIIYHPDLEIVHLKAPRGGFREIIKVPWENDHPKPSPTLMAFMKKYYTSEQLKGYKIELALKYYNKQDVIDPRKYLTLMNKRWKISEKWASKLIAKSNSGKISETV